VAADEVIALIEEGEVSAQKLQPASEPALEPEAAKFAVPSGQEAVPVRREEPAKPLSPSVRRLVEEHNLDSCHRPRRTSDQGRCAEFSRKRRVGTGRGPGGDSGCAR